jgi:hypothetical protein
VCGKLCDWVLAELLPISPDVDQFQQIRVNWTVLYNITKFVDTWIPGHTSENLRVHAWGLRQSTQNHRTKGSSQHRSILGIRGPASAWNRLTCRNSIRYEVLCLSSTTTKKVVGATKMSKSWINFHKNYSFFTKKVSLPIPGSFLRGLSVFFLFFRRHPATIRTESLIGREKRLRNGQSRKPSQEKPVWGRAVPVCTQNWDRLIESLIT